MPIEHVVVLCLENRSFDHMLGFLDHGNADYDGLRRGGPFDNKGFDGGPRVPATPGAKKVVPFGPDHSHNAVMQQLAMTGLGRRRRPTNDGFVISYERKARGLDPPRFGGLLGPLLEKMTASRQRGAVTAPGWGSLAMQCQAPARVPVLSTLALEFAVCDGWFCSVPGETWPNRNYLHAATSDGETDIEIRQYTNRTIFQLLEDNGADWRIYFDDTPQVWAFPALWDTPERHAKWFPITRFAAHAAAGDLPAYSFIEPNHRPPLHTLDHDTLLGGAPDVSDSQHPENNLVSLAAYEDFDEDADTDFSRGEGLIASVYEALRANPALFASTLLVITYDEHGGLYDHRPPPTGVPAPGHGRGPVARLLHAIWHRQVQAFDFTMLGARVPAVLVSPLIEPGTVLHEEIDHASVPSTLRHLFAPNAKPLTRRDAWAQPFAHVASRAEPRTGLVDLSRYVRPAVRVAAELGPDTVPAAGTVRDTGTMPDTGTVPGYYRDFIAQADLVRDHLTTVGEPEVAGPADPSALRRAVQTSRDFSAAAERHRRELAGRGQGGG